MTIDRARVQIQNQAGMWWTVTEVTDDGYVHMHSSGPYLGEVVSREAGVLWEPFVKDVGRDAAHLVLTWAAMTGALTGTVIDRLRRQADQVTDG